MSPLPVLMNRQKLAISYTKHKSKTKSTKSRTLSRLRRKLITMIPAVTAIYTAMIITTQTKEKKKKNLTRTNTTKMKTMEVTSKSTKIILLEIKNLRIQLLV